MAIFHGDFFFEVDGLGVGVSGNCRLRLVDGRGVAPVLRAVLLTMVAGVTPTPFLTSCANNAVRVFLSHLLH